MQNETSLAIEIPQSANLQLPDPEILTYYKNLQNRVVWIDCEIDKSILEVSRLIIQWNMDDKDIPVEERKPIKIFIFSYGGDGVSCFSLLDTMDMSKTPIYTFNMGVAMSAGLLILLAGHKRFCTKTSTALIHSGSGNAQGTYEQTEAQMKDYQHFVQDMKDYILAKTNIDTKTFAKNRSKEWYIYSDEQVKLHIVDAIITDIDTLC